MQGMKKLLLLAQLAALCFGENETYQHDEVFDVPDMFENEIILTKNRWRRSATTSEIWTNGTIPYRIEGDNCIVEQFSTHQEKLIGLAMQHIEQQTCIRFVQREVTDENYLHIRRGDGCYTPALGMSGGAHPLYLGTGCVTTGILLHELGHVIGLHHEHTRPDRDDYLIIYYDNIDPAKVRHFYKVDPKDIIITDAFDYESIMLYGERVFAKNKDLKTMVSKDPTMRLKSINMKSRLSKSDVNRINRLYNCPQSN